MFLLSYIIIQEEERRHFLASLSYYYHHMIDPYDRSTPSAAAVTAVPPRLHVNWRMACLHCDAKYFDLR